MSFNVACCVQCMFCTRCSRFVYVPSSLFCCFDVNVHVSEHDDCLKEADFD